MFHLKKERRVCTHCRTSVVHLACYVNCGYLDDQSVSLSYWSSEPGPGAQELVAKVTLINRVTRTNFKLAAILDVGMRLSLVVREEEKFTFT